MNHVCSDQTRHSRVSRAFLTHSFSISLACGCFSFLALSRSKNRSLSRPSASPSLSEIIVWCWNGSSFLSFSASCRKRMKAEQVNFDICQWSKWQSVIYCLFFFSPQPGALLPARHLSPPGRHSFASERSARPGYWCWSCEGWGKEGHLKFFISFCCLFWSKILDPTSNKLQDTTSVYIHKYRHDVEPVQQFFFIIFT